MDRARHRGVSIRAKQDLTRYQLLVIWFAIASVSMIVVKPATGASTPGNTV